MALIRLLLITSCLFVLTYYRSIVCNGAVINQVHGEGSFDPIQRYRRQYAYPNGSGCKSNMECASNCCIYNEDLEGGECVTQARVGEICGLMPSEEERQNQNQFNPFGGQANNNRRFGK